MAVKKLSERRAEKQAEKQRRALSANSKAVVAEKAKQAVRIANVRKNMIGYCVEWVDTDPLGDSGEQPARASSTHSNQRVRAEAQDLWDNLHYRAWITGEVFTWEAEVVLVFRLLKPRPDKTHRDDIVYVRHTGRLRDPIFGEDTPINREIEKQIMAEFLANSARPDGDKNKGVFVKANYKITCVGI
jgi:hypothetical protein